MPTDVHGSDDGVRPPRDSGPFDRRRSVAKIALGAGLVTASLVFGYQYGMEIRSEGSGTISVSDAIQCLQAGADLYFNVTLGTEAYLKRLGEWEGAKDRLQTAQVFILSANTHVGAITKLRLDNKLFLYAGGQQYPAVGKTLAATKHHNTYLAYFPRRGMDGEPLFEKETGAFRIVIRDVGKLKSRIFKFNFPLPMYRDSARLGIKQLLTLIGAVLAALLISCTPCLVGTLTLGSLTMSTGWGEAGPRSRREIQAEMMRKTGYFLVAIAAGYLIISVAVSSLGIEVTDFRPLEVVGGIVLATLGLSLLRKLGPVAWVVSRVRSRLPERWRSAPADDDGSVGAGSSSAMGGSLAMLCSVAGAPTLTTSIVVPVMIYAGTSSLTWAFFIIFIFLTVSAVPFFFIATGLGEILFSLSARWRGALLFGNSVLLIALGTIMIFNSDAVANVISAPAELVLDTWRWIAT